jgi:hypothetical protein
MLALWLLNVGSWLSRYFSPLRDFRPLTTSKEVPSHKLSDDPSN